MYQSLDASTFEYLSDRIIRTVAFYTFSITQKNSVSPFSPSQHLVTTSRFDPYMPVIWIREFAHDAWEPVEECVDWVIYRIKNYLSSAPSKPKAKEIVWKVHEDCTDLQKALISKGFIIESHYKQSEKYTFSMILS